MKLHFCFSFLSLFLWGCTTFTPPPEFTYQEISTRNFTIATWQNQHHRQGVYKIYLEGDGYAFNHSGRPSSDPTPHGTTMRELAFGDPHDNVVYMARPCQYVKSDICSPRHWSTARFAPEIITSTAEAIKEIAGDNEVILIGYSGGAQIAGLVASSQSGINVKKIITIAGNLNHLAWTNYHHLPSLNESMSLESYKNTYASIPQIHYLGETDEVIPPFLSQKFINDDSKIKIVPNATHSDGFQSIYPLIWAEE